MLAFISLFFPAAVMVVWKRRLFKEEDDWKAMLMEYIAGVVLINFLVIAVTYLFFGSGGSVVSNINTYNAFALKYIFLALLLALGLPCVFFFCKKKLIKVFHDDLKEAGIPAGKALSQEKSGNQLPLFMLMMLLTACLLSTFVFDLQEDINHTALIIVWLYLLLILFLYVKLSGRKLSAETILMLLFITGFLLRLNYILYTHADLTAMVRQHDTGSFALDSTESGHADYIRWFFNNPLKLPETPTVNQFYHPPLHHWTAAVWMRFLSLLGFGYGRAAASVQFLTLFYSSACMIVFERILHALHVKGIGKAAAFSIVAFHPTFIILAGSINNDILSILLTLLAIYFTITWYQKPTMKNIILIALSVGLGMTTKITVALIAPPIAVVFLIKFIMERKNFRKFLGQYCIFGCICVPLGMWYALWKLICYDVPLNFVQKLSLTSNQYVGFHSVYERLVDFSYNPFENIYVNRITTGADFFEYNPFVAVIKFSVFGQYVLAPAETAMYFSSWLLLIINILLILLSVYSMFCFARKYRTISWPLRFFVVFYHIFLFVYYIVFCFQYPHTCSMDFRYITPTCVTGALYIGIFINHMDKRRTAGGKVFAAAEYLTISAVAGFCLLSSIIYVLLGM